MEVKHNPTDLYNKDFCPLEAFLLLKFGHYNLLEELILNTLNYLLAVCFKVNVLNMFNQKMFNFREK